jgi:DNA primase
MALTAGFGVMAVATPFGKDAADAVKENPKLWQEAVASPTPYIGLILKKSLEKFKSGTLEAKKAVALAVLPFIKSVASPLERDHWLGELSLKIGVEKNILVSELKSVQVYGVEGAVIANKDNFLEKAAETEQSARIKQEEYLAALLIRYPELKKLITEDDLVIFSQPGMIAAVRVIMDGGEVKVGEMGDSAVLAGDFLDEFAVEPKTEFLKILTNLRRQYIQSRLKIIQADMSKAETESDSSNLELLKVEFNKLSKKLNG